MVLYSVLWVLGRVVPATTVWVRLSRSRLKVGVMLPLAMMQSRRNDAMGLLTCGMTAEMPVPGRYEGKVTQDVLLCERRVFLTKLIELLKLEQTWFPTWSVPVRLNRLIRTVVPMSATCGRCETWFGLPVVLAWTTRIC